MSLKCCNSFVWFFQSIFNYYCLELKYNSFSIYFKNVINYYESVNFTKSSNQVVPTVTKILNKDFYYCINCYACVYCQCYNICRYKIVQSNQFKYYNIGDNKTMTSKIVYFLAYSYAFVLYGSIITGMGPIIPYFSEATGKPQTEFSFIFFLRACGYLMGGSMIKYLTNYFNTHQILIGVELVGGLAFIVSSLSLSFLNLGITMFLGAACCCMINVVCNMCIMKLHAGPDQDYWIQLLHLIFGGGGLIGPLIIIKFQQHSFFIIGLLFLTSIPIFYMLHAPQSRDSQRKSQLLQPINRKAQIITCVLYLLYIGQQVGFGSWIPTYAVLNKVTTLQGASILGSMFWISNTSFRIILLYVKGKISDRLNVLLIGMVGTCLFMTIMDFIDEPHTAAYFGVILVGMFLASMFALYLALPIQFRFKVTTTNTANFMMSASMGEGALIMPIGYAMGFFGPYMLFVLMLLFSVTSYFLFRQLMKCYQQQDRQRSPLHQRLSEVNQNEAAQKLPF